MEKAALFLVCIYLSLFLRSSVATATLFPFGPDTGDTVLTGDDSASPSQTHTFDYPFYGTNYSTLFVNSNGVLSFGNAFTSSSPTPLSGFTSPLIVPFWADINTGEGGTIYYRFASITSSIVATLDSYIMDSSFSPSLVFIATWDEVAEFRSNGVDHNTFQVVLASDGSRSYTFFLYNDIQWIDAPTIIGFDSGDGTRFFSLSESSVDGSFLNLERSSNIGMPGVFAFRVDQSAIRGLNDNITTSPGLLFLYGSDAGDNLLQGDNSATQSLMHSNIPFYGSNVFQIYVNSNGVLSFGFQLTAPSVRLLSSDIFIAPFYTDINTNIAGRVFYRFATITTSIRDQIRTYIMDSSFSPSVVLLATWDGVARAGGSSETLNTFQLVLASDGSQTYALFLYEDIQWIASPLRIGFNAGDETRSFMLSESSVSGGFLNLESSSNVEIPGVFAYRVDQSAIQEIIDPPTDPPMATGELFPFGVDEGDQPLTGDDSASPAQTLSPMFPFYGTSYSTLFVSTNGLLSFNRAYTSSTPRELRLVSDVIIAPYWADITEGIRGGQIFYRFSTSSSIRNLLRLYITDSSFTPSVVFIATWNGVAEFNTPGFDLNTFQVILASDGSRSFVLFLYEDIQWTYFPLTVIGFNSGDGTRFFTQVASVNIESRSNIDVPGAFLYRVDQNTIQGFNDITTVSPTADTTVPVSPTANTTVPVSPTANTTSPATLEPPTYSGSRLFPFGTNVGDVQLSGDDSTSPAQTLSPMFPFLGTSYSTLYVNTNGLLSFDASFTSSSPQHFPLSGRVLISPFWADINVNVFSIVTGEQGRIFYRSASITSSIRNQLGFYISDSSFSPSSVFIATWDEVAEFGSTGQDLNTFQVVLASDGSRSYAIFLYDNIQWIDVPITTIGFNGNFGGEARALTLSEFFGGGLLNLESSSNIGIPGVLAYRVDQSDIQDVTGITTGPPTANTTIPVSPTDNTTVPVSPTANTTAPVSPTANTTVPVSPTANTTVPVSPTANTTVPVSPTANTTVPVSSTGDTTAPVVSTTTPATTEPPTSTGNNLFPFGADEGDLLLTGDDNASPARILSPMFPFYGTSYSALFVSTNGLLSFNGPYRSSSPRSFPLVEEEVLISPFWADINTDVRGRIFFRFSSITSSILSQLDLYIRDSSFTPSLVFIATWDGVAEYSSTGQDLNTFQVVLASDGSRSYVIFLYDDIQWTDIPITTIGFNAGDGTRFFSLSESSVYGGFLNLERSTNVQTPGVFSYRVDQDAIEASPASTTTGPLPTGDSTLPIATTATPEPPRNITTASPTANTTVPVTPTAKTTRPATTASTGNTTGPSTRETTQGGGGTNSVSGTQNGATGDLGLTARAIAGLCVVTAAALVLMV